MTAKMLRCGVLALTALAGCSSDVGGGHQDYLGQGTSTDNAANGAGTNTSSTSTTSAGTNGAPLATGTTGVTTGSGTSTSDGLASGNTTTSGATTTTGGVGTTDAGTLTSNVTTAGDTTTTQSTTSTSGTTTGGASQTTGTMFGGMGGAGNTASASDAASVTSTVTATGTTTSTTGANGGSDDCRLMLGDVPVCCTAGGDDRSDVDEVFELLNAYRTSLGLDALAYDPVLEEAIQGHCKHMSEADFFDHISPVAELETPWDRAEMCGTSANAENIAWGYRSPADVMEGWQNSPGHDQNMRTTGSSRVGIGKYGEYWGQIFGR